MAATTTTTSHFTSNGGNKLHKENLRDQLEECVSVTKVACSELFDLTLLVPSAPWVRFNFSTRTLK